MKHFNTVSYQVLTIYEHSVNNRNVTDFKAALLSSLRTKSVEL